MKQKKSLGTIMKREWPLHVMLLPAIILLIIFAYLPMVGIVIAFQDFVPSGGMKGFFTSEWVGLDNFKYIFGMKDFRQVLVNTLVIALLKIIAGIIVPLILALLLNEVNNKVFKKATPDDHLCSVFPFLGGPGRYSGGYSFAYQRDCKYRDYRAWP